MAAFQKLGRTGFAGAAEKIIVSWALLGGLVLLGVVGVNIYSVIGNMLGAPFPGDIELTQMGVVVAIFSFLPFCQITDSNVTADIFTSKVRPRTQAFLALLASLIAFGFALLLLWRMYNGMSDQREYEYTTTILQMPIWFSYLPVLFSLALLALASLITLKENSQHVIEG
ncbi:TRAP transporter small permease [Rhodobacteraceae bacterium RKSG542]|uniref:TRAP transporter small permease n=1 Tax=Pseudovibrio flavus TaxID=2529854 RepID=UPI0012BCA32A|nr:TRAP transporter small permease [Pseudovibrio flavus]MTI18865.1 TRAP transporter small permease [Pseudovibrio flavus]